MATTNKTGWAAQLRWAVLAALGTAALVVTGNEARADELSSLEITPVLAVTDETVAASVSDIEDAIAEVVVSNQRIGWLEGVDAVRVQVDNDLFAGGNQDRDYTGGLGITLSGERARDGLLSLDPLLARLDRLVFNGEETNVHYARQIGLLAFTPKNTLVREVQPDDRPYASLLFLSNGRVTVDEDDRGAWTSSLTIGVLGLSVSESLHSAVHELVGSERPLGYDHQISAGGEPTARYTLARQQLWIADPSGQIDVKTTLQGSVGFLTETSASISVRAGRFNSPWWSFAPELTDYMAAPVPSESYRGGRELYVFAGARVKARAYNAFLQGQFRDSEVRYTSGEVQPLLAEAWIGVVTQILDQTQLSYALHYQTAELRDGPASRDALWGAVQLTHAF
ncbi:lipid A deacylase LpxR family protein [Peristeroidobacter agariperforans]|uniref:lipid A deacylase LpxR family protein n=1 Tax=Peristeroidobacter agariperforans TaxID=268404 RepID=UPI00101BAF34|nr:lipid A deacylase LpxR family protein [Peristeroidobacter agariperforans]